MSKLLRRKERSEIEAVQFDGLNAEEVINFASADNITLDPTSEGGHCFGRPNQSPTYFQVGDWIAKDAEGYFYVLADSLKQRIYDEV